MSGTGPGLYGAKDQSLMCATQVLYQLRHGYLSHVKNVRFAAPRYYFKCIIYIDYYSSVFLNSISHSKYKKLEPGIVVHNYNPSSLEAK